jgi:HD superfamily phosphohydrolase
MELAGRLFDVITAQKNRDERVQRIFPPHKDALRWWRRVVRMAALCHDLGHLPFSHGAEAQLLPAGRTHESVTVDLIRSDEMRRIWERVTPPLRPDDIVKLAVGPKELRDQKFTEWERILAEAIVGDSFGVDRMDYLLRDSLHAGVVYGKFDQFRLIDTLRVLPENDEAGAEPVLGIESGGLQSAEGLLLARYFMYSQVYYHPVRRVYDIHLQDFLTAWLGEKNVPTELEEFLRLTDNEVLAEIAKAAADASHPGHDPADRIVHRKHFRVLYERNPYDAQKNPDAGEAVHQAACREFGAENVRHDRYVQKGSATAFPVRLRDRRIVSSLAVSDVLNRLPLVNLDYVFVAPEITSQAETWLAEKREEIIVPIEEDLE